MDPLQSLAAFLASPTGPAQPASLAPAPGSTGELFDAEVERAIERQDSAGGQRVQESRAAAIEERRAQRRASFDNEGSSEKLTSSEDSDTEGTQVLVDGPVRSPHEGASSKGGAAPAGEPAPGGAGQTQASTGSPSTNSAEAPLLKAPTSLPQAGNLAPTQAKNIAAAGPQVVGSVAATSGAQAGSPNAGAGTATFLQAARGGPGATALAQSQSPAGDAALVEHAAEVLRQIRLALSPTARRVVVDLNPESLGRLTIKMSVQDGRVAASVRAESQQTLELLERHLPELRSVLAERGVETGEVELRLASDGGSQGGERRAGSPSRNGKTNTPAELAAPEPAATSSTRTSVDGIVDTYA